MKHNIAIASVVLAIVAIALLVFIDSEPAARALDAVGPSWFAPWPLATAAHLEATPVSGPRGQPDERSALSITTATSERGKRSRRRSRQCAHASDATD